MLFQFRINKYTLNVTKLKHLFFIGIYTFYLPVIPIIFYTNLK